MVDESGVLEPFAFAIFCDDIRFEIGNKVTLVGIYSGDMFLQELPAFIPKLGVAVTLVTPLHKSPSSLTVRISKGDDLALEFVVPVVPGASPALSDEHDAPTRRSFIFQVPLPPMTIPAPCMLRVALVVDGVEMNAGKLRIGLNPAPPAP